MRHKTSQKIFDYWNRLRDGRSAPNRCEIEPNDIRDILGDTFILEINPTYKTISYRLAGTRLCSTFGRELKGVGFLTLWDEEDNMKVMDAVRTVYQQHKACTMSVVGQSEANRFVEFEMVLLPLTGEHESDIRILGVVTPKAVPFWLGSDAIFNKRLNSVRFRDDQAGPSVGKKIPFVPYRPGTRPSTQAPQSRKVKHLMVFEGGRQD